MTNPAFIPGVDLARGFYADVVAPIIGARPHAAARVGWGSDVLGYDTPRSTDHGWGPQLLVLIDPADPGMIDAIKRDLDVRLPDQYQGFPVRFGWDEIAVSHHVTVTTLPAWSQGQLGFDTMASGAPTTVQWISTPQQKLLEGTSGAVFHDGLGDLTRLRQRLTFYPDQVWLWMLACQWRRIDQEEPFVGRTAELGDTLGSHILAARMARELMRLWFLFNRRYWPYSKWFGTAFARLGDPPTDAVTGALMRAIGQERSANYEAREEALVEAYELTARAHNKLGVTDPVDPTGRLFYNRPFRVIGADRFVAACLDRVTDPTLRALPPVGSIDQMADSTDVLSYPERVRTLITYSRAPG